VSVVRAVLLVILIMVAQVPPAITPALRRVGGGGGMIGDALKFYCYGGRLMWAARHRAVACFTMSHATAAAAPPCSLPAEPLRRMEERLPALPISSGNHQ
jgi:hypothetical protein